MTLTEKEIERLDRLSLRYPKRYFDKFRVQRQFFAANLDDQFFKDWFNILTKQGQDLKTNFSKNSESCTWLLLLHPDCPDWLREQYKNFPKVEGRRAALLGGDESYQFKNVDLILKDRSKTIKEGFFHRLTHILVSNNQVDSEIVIKALQYVKNSDDRFLNLNRRHWQIHPIVSFYNDFKVAIEEGVAGLVNPNSKIRSKSEFLYKQPQEIQQKIQLILKG